MKKTEFELEEVGKFYISVDNQRDLERCTEYLYNCKILYKVASAFNPMANKNEYEINSELDLIFKSTKSRAMEVGKALGMDIYIYFN